MAGLDADGGRGVPDRERPERLGGAARGRHQSAGGQSSSTSTSAPAGTSAPSGTITRTSES
ncbi:hypothetical protein CTI14_48170, partial [Methylobacterium radiotolerans]